MSYIFALNEVKIDANNLIGGKAASLFRLQKENFLIPDSFVISTEAYESFVEGNKLRGFIQLELNRKDLNQCRWEELWDISLRIKNSFLKGKLSNHLKDEITALFHEELKDSKLAARSSSTVEDSANRSFAGLHDSYLDISNLSQLIQKIKLIWASLWSDAALSYRKELDLSTENSSMAVLLQKMINGQSSGIAFSQNPFDAKQTVIEAVYGINQGLVDGKIEPDRWFLNRQGGKLLKHAAALREEKLVSGTSKPKIIKTKKSEKINPPLNERQLKKVFELCCNAESYYHKPQDVEWTFEAERLFLLQSRPITVKSTIDPQQNRKEWDLSLKRSFDNLLELQKKIEVYLKEMTLEAAKFRNKEIKSLSDDDLRNEYTSAEQKLKHWTEIYWETFIPYGHGMRLFGQIYNEVICPDDPYEFISILQNSSNLATRRNDELNNLALLINADEANLVHIKSGTLKSLSKAVKKKLSDLVVNYALPSTLTELDMENKYTKEFFSFVVRQTKNCRKRKSAPKSKIKRIEDNFLKSFPAGDERAWANQLMELGRHSFLMRDDDNVFLDRFKDAKSCILLEVQRRLKNRHAENFEYYSEAQLLKKLEQPNFITEMPRQITTVPKPKVGVLKARKRQVTGQPAGPGYITGIARLIDGSHDLFALQKGEIIICDAIGPEMTFAVPIAGGIVERRGGMLIHGAIIAREYGIPCVTGVADAMKIINTGDKVSIDGYLGIVAIVKRG